MGNWMNRDRKIDKRHKVADLNHRFENTAKMQKKRKKKDLRITEKFEDDD